MSPFLLLQNLNLWIPVLIVFPVSPALLGPWGWRTQLHSSQKSIIIPASPGTGCEELPGREGERAQGHRKKSKRRDRFYVPDSGGRLTWRLGVWVGV